MKNRFENNFATFGVITLEFFLFLSFPDVTILRNIFAITCGIFLYQTFDTVKFYLRGK